MDPIPFLTKEERQYHMAIREKNLEASTNLPEISSKYVIEPIRNPEPNLSGQTSSLRKPQEGAPQSETFCKPDPREMLGEKKYITDSDVSDEEPIEFDNQNQ